MSDLFKDLFIFEMANNHQGSVEHGLRIIEEMGKITRKHHLKAGVKFQYRDLDTFIHPDFKARKDVKHIPRFLSTRLTDEQFRILIDAVRKNEMIPVCTPFDEVSVGKCLEQGIEILKVASCSALDWPLLEVVGSAGKPVIISTGGQTIYDIDKIVSFFTHREVEFALMHCVGLYPVPDHRLHLNFISKLKKRYQTVPIGYSGHEAPDNTETAVAAVAKGAEILERHVGVPTDTVDLNQYSMNPEQTEVWIEAALKARIMCGESEDKTISGEERESLAALQRGVYAAGKIKKGEPLNRGDVFFAMPAALSQTTSGEFGTYRAKFFATRDYEINQPIYERSRPDPISKIRNIIHDVKGMIFEANVPLGKDFEIELSHHYGIEHFRETGALIVNVINRAYGKKIVALLPGQKHPMHHHKIKEETFQLLWGDMEVQLNGRMVKMQPGDKLLIEAGVLHGFTSQTGAVFEEVSTTHIKDDSYYEDPQIDRLDPMQRKTIIEEW